MAGGTGVASVKLGATDRRSRLRRCRRLRCRQSLESASLVRSAQSGCLSSQSLTRCAGMSCSWRVVMPRSRQTSFESTVRRL